MLSFVDIYVCYTRLFLERCDELITSYLEMQGCYNHASFAGSEESPPAGVESAPGFTQRTGSSCRHLQTVNFNTYIYT